MEAIIETPHIESAETMQETEHQIASLSKAADYSLEQYLSHLENETPADLYDIFIEQVELPLIQVVMNHTMNNQSKAAKWLGISRGTFRKKP